MFHMLTTLVDASDCGIGSVALAFERVCALREEAPDFYPATLIKRGKEVEGFGTNTNMHGYIIIL